MNTEQTPNIEYFTAEIERMGKELDLDANVRQFSLTIFERVVEAEIRYTSMNRIATVCLYITCRLQQQPVTLPGIAAVSRVSQKEIHTVSSRISKALGLSITLTDPNVHLKSYCEELELETNEIDRILEVSEAAKAADEHINTVPSTFAASVLYAASKVFDLGVNQKDIASVGSTSTVTIRKNYRSMVEAFQEYSSDVDIPSSAYPARSVEKALERLGEEYSERDNDIQQARSMLEAHSELLQSGKDEGAITAAAFMTVIGDESDAPTTEEVASIMGVTVHTVRSRIADIKSAQQPNSVE